MANVKFPRKEFEKHIKLSQETIEKIQMLGPPIESLTKDEIEVEIFPNRPDMLSMHGYIRAFDDVTPILDALDSAGIPYGAVSNNVHDYQRVKLDAAGLERIRVLVGTDTVGAAKPDPAIYLEGVRRLGTGAGETLYVGDNRLLDADGSTAAGLLGVWLNRGGEPAPGFTGREIGSLLELLA